MPVLIFMMYFNSIFNTTNFLFIDKKRTNYTDDANLLWILALLVVVTPIGICAQNIMYYKQKVSTAKLIMSLSIVMTLAFDVVVMDEDLTLKEIIGCALIMIANIAIGIGKAKPKQDIIK